MSLLKFTWDEGEGSSLARPPQPTLAMDGCIYHTVRSKTKTVRAGAPGQGELIRMAEECEAALLAKGIAGETERGRSQRLDAVWSGEPLGICKAHPKKGAICLEA